MVGVLLSNTGSECVKIYYLFMWAPAVFADEDKGVAHRTVRDKYNLDPTCKVDPQLREHKALRVSEYKRRNICGNEFLAWMERKTEYCRYEDHKDGFICDMVING